MYLQKIAMHFKFHHFSCHVLIIFFTTLNVTNKKTTPSGWMSGTYQLRLQVCDLLPQLLAASNV